jgi:hypothetical protein
VLGDPGIRPGRLARDLIRSEGPRLPEDLVREVLREVAAALAYMHQDLAGPGQPRLAHRDVKPENAGSTTLAGVEVSSLPSGCGAAGP